MVDAEESDLAEGLGEGYRKPCSIHTLNLLVNDILKTIPAKYRSVVTKCKIAAAKQPNPLEWPICAHGSYFVSL